jgi:hypothetical protein
MIDTSEVKDPRWVDRLELPNGGGVLLRSPELPSEPTRMPQVKRRPAVLMAQTSAG